MNVLLTIELRIAYDDENKYERAIQVAKQAALQAYATVALLDDGDKPQIAVYADDYEHGRRDVPLTEFIPQERP
jgi:hypothetical protein